MNGLLLRSAWDSNKIQGAVSTIRNQESKTTLFNLLPKIHLRFSRARPRPHSTNDDRVHRRRSTAQRTPNCKHGKAANEYPFRVEYPVRFAQRQNGRGGS